jgi:hypothetical protein
MRIRRMPLIVFMLLGIGFAQNLANAQTITAAEQAAVAGPWSGRWTAPEGWLYEAAMTLRVAASGTVDGEINWTMRKSPRPADQKKLGMSGMELIRGTYHAASGAFVLEGYDKKDPNTILGLDKYRLIASDDRMTLAGVTAHHDRWNAQFWLTRN